GIRARNVTGVQTCALPIYLAATMLATTLNLPFDADKAWDEREQEYKMTGEIVKTRAVVQTAEGDKAGLWTSVIAAAVFILDTEEIGKRRVGKEGRSGWARE